MTLDGAPWFVAADVCRVLGHSNPSVSVRMLGSDEQAKSDLGSGPRVNIVSEQGLYRLIMRSDKPVARPFQDWVTREVLPAIRKTGEFKLAPGEVIPLPASFTDALRQHGATLIKLAEEQEAHAKSEHREEP